MPKDMLNRDLKVGDVVTYSRSMKKPAFATVTEIKTDGPIASRVWVSENGKKPHIMKHPSHLMILNDISEDDARKKNEMASHFNFNIWGTLN